MTGLAENYKELLREILGTRIVAYYPSLANIVGGVKSAILLSQLLYYDSRQEVAGDWFKVRVKTIADHTGLTTKEQATARRELVKHKVLEVEKRGMPARYEYRVDLDALALIVAGTVSEATKDGGEETSFMLHKSSPTGDSRVAEGETLEFPNGQHIKESLKSPLKKKKEDSRSQDSWVQALTSIQHTHYRQSNLNFRKYWEATEYGGRQDGKFIVICQDEDQRAWLVDRGVKIAERALVGVLGERVEVEFVVGEPANR